MTSGDTVFDDFLEIASFSGFSDCLTSGGGFSGSGLTTGGTFLFDGVSAVAISCAAFLAAPLCGTIIGNGIDSPDFVLESGDFPDFLGDFLLVAAALDLDFDLTSLSSDSESEPSLLELEELDEGAGFLAGAFEGGDLVLVVVAFDEVFPAFLSFSDS